ncbi:MAG: GNAT family N-acetyltransferase, partial [Candidatus Micrarchaeota archaeon]
KEKRVRLAFSNGIPVGFIWFTVSDQTPFGVDYGDFGSRFAWVVYTYVLPECRKKGVATALYRDLAEWGKTNNVSEILCDVYEINSDSIKFHEKLGFKAFTRIYSKKLKR